MKNFNSCISVCRHCQHYTTEGRRGGQCQQLGVPVQGAWKACQFALPPFAPSWEHLEVVANDINLWEREALDGVTAILAQSTTTTAPINASESAEVLPMAAAIAQPALAS